MDNEHHVHVGVRRVWGGEQPFGLLHADRRYHAYVIGKTGSGKTSLLRNMLTQDIVAGHGVGILDPHGDLAEELLDHIPPSRTDDVVYFNPADLAFPIAFNPLANIPPDSRDLAASGMVSAFKGIWRESWGPRLEYILYNSIAALCHCQNVTLLGIQRMLSDETYRRWVVKQVSDPALHAFWTREFASYDKRFLSEVISPILNKVGQLLMAPVIRNILGQVRSRIDFRFMMDDRRIFIANLSKGRIGPDKSNLLGSLLVTQFQLAAMSRADIPEDERKDFFLVVDEYTNFCTDSFMSILSEARKFRLSLALSGQYLAQASKPIRDAVLGNVGTIMSFRVSESDAQVIARELGGEFQASHISGLANYEMCVRMMENSVSLIPFTARTLPPINLNYGRHENTIKRSRQKYANRRAVVEDKIRRWMRPDW